MSKRTDPHRVGAIIPEHYRIVHSYSLATSEGGHAVPSYGVNCELDRRVCGPKGEVLKSGTHDADGRCCVIGFRTIARVTFSDHGGTGKCSICGAAFAHGDIWQHEPTGELIHVGHTCADKYEMLAERGDFDARYESHKARTAAVRLGEIHATERAEFLDAHPGLAAALATDHGIVKDIAAKFQQYRSISDAQIALVVKLAKEASEPKAEEAHVPAPEGRVTFRGVIVSAKSQDGFAGGTSYRMTVKISTPDGTWLAWGTVPQGLFDEAREKLEGGDKGYLHALRGCEVELTATLKRGRDAHFALAKCPKKARIVTVPPEKAKAVRADEPAPDAFATFAA